jgi:hypothetical protein
MRAQVVAEPLNVEANDVVAALKELWNQYRPFIAASTGNKDFHA